MRSTQKDYKRFDKKPTVPYNKPLPVMTLAHGRNFDPTIFTNDHYINRMIIVRDWHQKLIDATSPTDEVFARNIPRHIQVRDDINLQLIGIANGD